MHSESDLYIFKTVGWYLFFIPILHPNSVPCTFQMQKNLISTTKSLTYENRLMYSGDTGRHSTWLADCSTRQHVAKHCNALTWHLADLENPAATQLVLLAATNCNTLQHIATHCNTLTCPRSSTESTPTRCTYCNTLRNTATYYRWHDCQSIRAKLILALRWMLAETRCNTLQHTATQSNTLHHSATHCNTLQHTATHCNTRWHIADSMAATPSVTNSLYRWQKCSLQHTATHCYTLQHTATHCNTCNTPWYTATHGNTLQTKWLRLYLWQTHSIAEMNAHCNKIQHTATQCNTLQHTAHTATHYRQHGYDSIRDKLAVSLRRLITATHFNTLQHTATHYNATPHCNTLQHTTDNMPATIFVTNSLSCWDEFATRTRSGFSTPCSLLYLICTIISNKTEHFDSTRTRLRS